MGKNPYRVRITGPLADHREGLIESLRDQGYTEQTSAFIARVMAQMSVWLSSTELRPCDLTSRRIAQFLAERRRSGFVQYVTEEGLEPIVGYLRACGVVPPKGRRRERRSLADILLEQYETFLARERAICREVIDDYKRQARDFLLRACGGRPSALGGLTAAKVISYFSAEARRTPNPGTLKNTKAAIRSFLRYLHLTERVNQDLSGAMPPIACWRLSNVPKHLTTEDLQRVLHVPDRKTPVGRRDYAVLLLLARLGLRANEVASLEIDDFNWAQGQVVVHGKGGRQDLMPIPQDIGAAIIAYLRRGRPRSDSRRLFLRARATHQPLTSGSVGAIARWAGQRCGITRMNAHRLRHTAACEMLKAGAGLEGIRQVLRHYHQDTTAIYAKVDYDSLICVSRPWPEVKQ
jgi:integrase/recombinase XerD